MKARDIVELLVFLGGAATAQDSGDYEYYDIRSPVDLLQFEDGYLGDIPIDTYGNEEGEQASALSTFNTAIIVLYCIIIFVGLIANSIVFFVIFAGHETETTSPEMDRGKMWTQFSIIRQCIMTTENETMQYMCAFESQSHHYKIWLVSNFILSFLIPFSVIVAMYAMILRHLRTVEQKIGHTATNRAVEMRKRVTKMVAALVICFTICWLPHHILTLLRIEGFYSSVAVCYELEEIFAAFAFSNSAINPILYTFLGYNFGERFRKSVHNTQLVFNCRTSGCWSVFRHRLNSTGDEGQKKSAGIAIYRRTSSNGSNPDSAFQHKSRKITLLGLKRDRSHSDKRLESDENGRTDGNDRSLLDHTVQTKLDTQEV